jgi:hypothetical protein
MAAEVRKLKVSGRLQDALVFAAAPEGRHVKRTRAAGKQVEVPLGFRQLAPVIGLAVTRASGENFHDRHDRRV